MQTQTRVTVYFSISSYVVIKYKHSPSSHSGPTPHSPENICYMWIAPPPSASGCILSSNCVCKPWIVSNRPIRCRCRLVWIHMCGNSPYKYNALHFVMQSFLLGIFAVCGLLPANTCCHPSPHYCRDSQSCPSLYSSCTSSADHHILHNPYS